ncbi:hypothetical protein [Nonomuraea jiangxiensis]|uniref:DNA-binding beta-propeller fold protein YncE n=1 Tax=Nonomuraea jiangxiensis TaxID=633440 RepID=A0A1G9G529_9ACTN|nr:hypothetical protein [Nonomuraea jiangxiensis]SDK95769.1 hypothetical protein SAMN05421869_120178 [Nonomuraea jiangxiensis]
MRWRAGIVAVLMTFVVGAAAAPTEPGSESARGSYEIWLVDQSDTNGLNHGGTVHVYDGGEVTRRLSAARPADRIDLGGATSSLCLASTGRNPVRPHMIVFNKADTHAALAFVASGHVVIFDAASRRPLSCLSTEEGAGGARQAHALWPTEDDRYLIVSNQNGKKLERIRTDYAAGAFTREPAATLDLAGCLTPSGAPCQAPEVRPDNAPICPYIASDNGPVFVSLRGGGMLVVNWRTTPMSIVAEYDLTHVPPNGCGFIEAKGAVFGDGGGGTPNNLDQFSVFRMPRGGYSASNPPNTPAVERLFDDDTAERDAHGTAVSAGERHVWVGDRDANVVEVFDGRTGARVNTVPLTSRFSADPTVDLFASSPDHEWVFASTRGPFPLSGDPHSSHGTDPGLLIVRMTDEGRGGEVRGLIRITNVDATGAERADGHGIRVRRVR